MVKLFLHENVTLFVILIVRERNSNISKYKVKNEMSELTKITLYIFFFLLINLSSGIRIGKSKRTHQITHVKK